MRFFILCISVFLFGSDYEPKNYHLNEDLNPKYDLIIEDSLYLQGFMLGSVGGLTFMPSTVTKWDKDKLAEKSLEDRWTENVSRPPVWDEDDLIVNYIGHPVAGAAYYMLAREDGLSSYESGVYSFLMSTFFWEYGYEAFAERPSIQDIIFTPLIGSFLGEEQYYWKRELNKKNGVLFGSKKVGDVAYFFLNPIGEMTHFLKKEVGVNTKIDFYYSVYDGLDSGVGFKLNIYF